MGEIMYHGANGDIVKPVVAGQYGMEAMIISKWADKHSLTVYYPEKLAPWVTLKNKAVIDDKVLSIWQESGLYEIGNVNAIGDSIPECAKKLKEYADQIEGTDITIDLTPMQDALKEIREAATLFKCPFGGKPVPSEKDMTA